MSVSGYPVGDGGSEGAASCSAGFRAKNAEPPGAARIQHLQRGKGDSEDPAQPLKGRSCYGLIRFYELKSAYQLSSFFLRKSWFGLIRLISGAGWGCL